jgi:hypothetical protein
VCISAPITPTDLDAAQDVTTTNIRYIHGPIQIAIFKFENVQWILFGDEHTPVEPSTSKDEAGIILKNNQFIFTGTNAPVVWSIERVLFNMFTKIKHSGLTADFYLETPIITKTTHIIEFEIQSYIQHIYNIFIDCFYAHILPAESTCGFTPNVKMHFVDYRQQTLHAFNDQNMTYYFDYKNKNYLNNPLLNMMY